ncbi:hypothetical protein ZWY2020_055728 [Hordeum vulgare]|nr:hypothetical protein ZWY2020_055728 [Hordeum vulgare]
MTSPPTADPSGTFSAWKVNATGRKSQRRSASSPSLPRWLLMSKICLKAESSFSRFLYGDQARFFNDEIRPELRHSKTGTIAMASAGENCNASQFYITLRDDVDYLDDKHTVFGTVAECLDTLTKINEAYVDDKGRPFKDIRIKHTYILDDPFDDPPQLAELIRENSPLGKPRDEVQQLRKMGEKMGVENT